jgi:malate dehydrogenase (oxaloacetate-decarboxylating)
MDEWEVFPRVAATAAVAAQAQGLARVTKSREDVYAEAVRVMRQARDATDALMRTGAIPEPPTP